MSRIATLGEIVVEIMAAKHNQRFDQPGWLRGPYPSGAPAIFIDQVAKLGTECRLIGCVGNDDFGRLNVKRLTADGVDTDLVRILDDQTTGSAFVTYADSGARDFIYNIANAACAQLAPADVEGEVLNDCSLFHVTGSSLFSNPVRQTMRQAVDIVSSQGGRISFDPNIRKEMLADNNDLRETLAYIFARTDILIPSAGEITALTQSEDEADAVRESLDCGISEIVIKKAEAGCVYHDAAQTLTVPGLTVEEIDPTGAGDCFAATYVTLRERGMGTGDALAYANASGANATQHIGPMEGTASLEQLQKLMESHARRA